MLRNCDKANTIKMQIRRFIKFWICVFCFCCLLFIGIYTRGRLAEQSIEYICSLESKSADTDSISHAYQNLCMTEQCKEEPANSAITSKPSIQNSPISSRLLLNVLLDVDRLNITFDGKIIMFFAIAYDMKHFCVLRLNILPW